jgi:hypothetical protein
MDPFVLVTMVLQFQIAYIYKHNHWTNIFCIDLTIFDFKEHKMGCIFP